MFYFILFYYQKGLDENIHVYIMRETGPDIVLDYVRLKGNPPTWTHSMMEMQMIQLTKMQNEGENMSMGGFHGTALSVQFKSFTK